MAIEKPVMSDVKRSKMLITPISYMKLHYAHNVNTKAHKGRIKGMEHVPNIFISFDKYLFLEVINILI